jgi:signal transduction histidine kinase
MSGETRNQLSRTSLVGIGVSLAAITLFHYLTDPNSMVPHNVYRRLYYLPIVWAAFAGGLWVGLGAAAVATVAYIPHAFFLHSHMDPAPGVDKFMEIILYFGVGGLAGLLVDRERQARARQQREALARTAAESRADRLSGLVHLSRGLAHEIRNPLGGIQGAIEILAEEVSRTSPKREMVDVGLRETGRLNTVLDDFLQFARPREPDMQPFAPGDAVRHVVELLKTEADKSGVKLLARPEDGITQAHGDMELITQVLLNLVRNAVQASGPGDTVEVVCRSAPAAIVFEVLDTGKGVPPELGDSIYDPYVTGREGGAGLGLAISSLLVQQHNNVLTHEPRADKGTVFRFDLPAAARQGGGA